MDDVNINKICKIVEYIRFRIQDTTHSQYT